MQEFESDEEDFDRYHRAFSGGIQEYIEAVSFMEYLDNNTLLSVVKAQEDINKSIPEGQPKFTLLLEDYLLGIGGKSFYH